MSLHCKSISQRTALATVRLERYGTSFEMLVDFPVLFQSATTDLLYQCHFPSHFSQELSNQMTCVLIDILDKLLVSRLDVSMKAEIDLYSHHTVLPVFPRTFYLKHL